MTKVRFDRVCKMFGDYTAVHELNFDIRDGEFLVMVGPSGCGKTTTLRMLAGLETPSYGRILMDDKDITLAPPGKRGVAMVFQSYALYPHLSVYRNLSFGMEIRGESRADRDVRVRRVAEMLGLSSMLERKPSALSGGQRQRIALGRAMITEPQLFLLDEPLSNLDAALRTQMRAEISEMQRRLGVPTVYVTHDQVEAMTMGHRIAVFDHGRMLQIGTPEELFKYPGSREVATFIGSPKMNIVLGQAVPLDGAPAARFLGGMFTLGEAGARRWMLVPGSEVDVGLRPQDLHWQREAPPRCTQMIEGRIEAIEPTGAETYVIVDVDGTKVNSRFSCFAPVAVGDQVTLAFDANDLHLFDRASGKTLREAAPSSQLHLVEA